MRDPISFGSPRFSGHWSRCNRRTSRHHQTSKRKPGAPKGPRAFCFTASPRRPPSGEIEAWTWRTPLRRHPLLNNSLRSSRCRGRAAPWVVLRHLVVDHAARPRLSYAGLAEWLRQWPSKPHTLGSIPTARSMRQRTRSSWRRHELPPEPLPDGVLTHGLQLCTAYSLCNGNARNDFVRSRSLNPILGPKDWWVVVWSCKPEEPGRRRRGPPFDWRDGRAANCAALERQSRKRHVGSNPTLSSRLKLSKTYGVWASGRSHLVLSQAAAMRTSVRIQTTPARPACLNSFPAARAAVFLDVWQSG